MAAAAQLEAILARQLPDAPLEVRFTAFEAGAVDEIVKHMTSGKDVKLADGTTEKHKVAKTMPANDMAQLKNLAEYILSIQAK
mgnify:CR=1 FL=1